MSNPDIDAIIGNFEFLEDWDDRYRYLIELGAGLSPLSDAEHNAENKVPGCASQVWLVTERGSGADPVLTIRGDSDAHIVRGLVAIVVAIFSGRRASQIVAIDEAGVFASLHLSQHITPQRSNGLRSMVSRIKETARKAQTA